MARLRTTSLAGKAIPSHRPLGSTYSLSGAMKHPLFATCLTMGGVLSFYVGSYFLCVSEVRLGFTRGDQLYAAPAYRYLPSALGSAAVYVYWPIHLIDEKCLRRDKWQARPAKHGELEVPVGPRRALFSVPYTNSP